MWEPWRSSNLSGEGHLPGLGSEAMLPNPPVVLVAEEAVVIVLFFEMSFSATFTQRYLEGSAHLDKMVLLMTSRVVS
jgi:hypothetical protein